jgi:hypothetical protein
MAQVTDRAATRSRPAKPPRPTTVIDDTLVTTGVFDMAPSEILRDPPDPEGDRLGNQVADAIPRRLAESGQPPAEPK